MQRAKNNQTILEKAQNSLLDVKTCKTGSYAKF